MEKELDLDHVPEAYRNRLPEILSGYDDMRNGKLGEINSVKHRIYLKLYVPPHKQRPYQTSLSSHFELPELMKWPW